MPPSLFVHTLEVGVPQKPRAARKGAAPVRGSTPGFGSPGTLAVTGTQNSGSPLPVNPKIPATKADARPLKPSRWTIRGIQVSPRPLRPLARRREITFLPPWVFMRVRNPCVFDRLRRLGWNVRLGHEKYLLLIRSTVLGQTVSINNDRTHYVPSGGWRDCGDERRRIRIRVRHKPAANGSKRFPLSCQRKKARSRISFNRFAAS